MNDDSNKGGSKLLRFPLELWRPFVLKTTSKYSLLSANNLYFASVYEFIKEILSLSCCYVLNKLKTIRTVGIQIVSFEIRTLCILFFNWTFDGNLKVSKRLAKLVFVLVFHHGESRIAESRERTCNVIMSIGLYFPSRKFKRLEKVLFR